MGRCSASEERWKNWKERIIFWYCHAHILSIFLLVLGDYDKKKMNEPEDGCAGDEKWTKRFCKEVVKEKM